jgi:cobalt-zinc-cadmium efflux system outer membrane protein
VNARVAAEAEASRLAASTQVLAESRRAAWARLATLVGLNPAAEGSTDHVRPAALSEESLSTLAPSAAPSEHPVVQVAALNLDSASASRELERRRLLPGLSLTIGVNAHDPGLPGPDRQATLSLTLPFGKRGLVALRVAEAEVRVQAAQLEAARRDLLESLVVASHRVRGARAQLVVYDREALPAAEEAARLTREAYEAGRGDVLRVVDTERALLDARSARLQAYADLKSAEADLLAAARENE